MMCFGLVKQILAFKRRGSAAAGRRTIARRFALASLCCLLPLAASTCKGKTEAAKQEPTAAQVQAAKETETYKALAKLGLSLDDPRTLKAFIDLLKNTPTRWPLEKSDHRVVTLKFQWTTDSAPGGGFLHTGVDIESPGRAAVIASAEGRVTVAGLGPDPDPYTGSGENTGQAVQVTLQHKHGFLSTYAHLAKDLPVKVGDAVQQGQVIGYVDKTSYREKPFLHFEVRLGTQYIDPMTFLSITPGVD